MTLYWQHVKRSHLIQVADQTQRPGTVGCALTMCTAPFVDRNYSEQFLNGVCMRKELLHRHGKLDVMRTDIDRGAIVSAKDLGDLSEAGRVADLIEPVLHVMVV